MATVKASCPTCNDVELTSQDVKVRVCTDTNSCSYLFRCPECQIIVVKDTEPRIVDLLVSSGCAYTEWHLPSELSEPHSTKPAFTCDDELEFHELLQEADWFERLTRRDSDS